MRFNKMTSYAIRIINRIVEEEGIVTSKTIYEKEGIPQGVLMKILRLLRQGELIESHQGRGGMSGGYSLAENQEDISIYQIIQVMEGGVELYPAAEEACYKEELSELYAGMKEASETYIKMINAIYLNTKG